ncbi:MAG: L-serine ammonia-lyase, iron-sulfur-dependent subunit beta [Bacillota bacterium]
MNVFDIIGPVMVGPSSSHTAGAVRIGIIARELLGEPPLSVVVKFHGSFARTYKGHGTDRAIIAGLMGMSPDDLRIRESLSLAAEAGLEFSFESIDLLEAHPNTVLLEITGVSGKKVTVVGASVGGGNILIKKVNGLNVEFSGEYDTLIVSHQDAPGVIAAVTNLLAYNGINIANMKVYRSGRGGDAIMIIETDQGLGEELVAMISKMPRITSATEINPI